MKYLSQNSYAILCDWLLGTIVLTLLQQPFISLSATLCTRWHLSLRMFCWMHHFKLPDLCCFGLSMIPKPDGEWHTIYHISVPHRSSINDFIDPEQYSLSYCSVDYAFAIVNTLGKESIMAKIDLKMCPVLSQWGQRTGTCLACCKKNYYINTCLPFSPHSTPFLFNQLSKAIHWTFQHRCHVQIRSPPLLLRQFLYNWISRH